MVERLAVLFLFALLLFLLPVAGRWWQRRRVAALQAAPIRPLLPAGRAGVISFSTPTCADCRSRQAPALDQLALELAEQVVVRRLSALEHPELVQQLGILTVPATVVVDRRGTVQHLNLGFASAATLRHQLEPLLGQPATRAAA